MLNKCYFNQTKKQLLVTANVTRAYGDKTDLNARFRYFNEAYCDFFVCEFI